MRDSEKITMWKRHGQGEEEKAFFTPLLGEIGAGPDTRNPLQPTGLVVAVVSYFFGALFTGVRERRREFPVK